MRYLMTNKSKSIRKFPICYLRFYFFRLELKYLSIYESLFREHEARGCY